MSKTLLLTLAVLSSLFVIAGSLVRLQHGSIYAQYAFFACASASLLTIVGYIYYTIRRSRRA